jgi:acetyl-CoA acetyltransferase
MRQQRVGIIGAGYEGFRPLVSDLSTRELMFEAASKAYDDASIDPRRDVGSFICCTEDFWEGWSITDEMVPDQIGAAGRPLCTIPADAVTGLGNAMMHILAGVADVVVLEAHSKSADVLDKDAVERLGQEPTMIRPLGASSDVLAALEMDGFLRRTGYDLDDVNDFLISSKKRALRNARDSYRKALERAGVTKGLDAFDILELDDTYSYKALQHLHSLAKSGAEEKRVTSGVGPALNPSGGSLGVGNLLEASAIHRLLECYLQLKGEAGPVQVKGAERALVQSWRGIPTATGGVAVLSR